MRILPHCLLFLVDLSYLIDYKYQISICFICYDRHAAKTWDLFIKFPNILSTPFLLVHATAALDNCCLGLNVREMELFFPPYCVYLFLFTMMFLIAMFVTLVVHLYFLLVSSILFCMYVTVCLSILLSGHI